MLQWISNIAIATWYARVKLSTLPNRRVFHPCKVTTSNLTHLLLYSLDWRALSAQYTSMPSSLPKHFTSYTDDSARVSSQLVSPTNTVMRKQFCVGVTLHATCTVRRLDKTIDNLYCPTFRQDHKCNKRYIAQTFWSKVQSFLKWVLI